MSTKVLWLRRHHRRMMWLMLALLLTPAIGALVWFLITRDARAFMLLIAMTLANVVNIINPLTFRRLKRRVSEHEGLLCAACLFPLEGLAEQGRCPECGSDYDLETTIQSWQRDLGVPATDPKPGA